MKLYLARHGESVGNALRLFFGQTDFPLTEAGLAQAKMLGKKLEGIEFDICYTSTLTRAVQTAEGCLEGRSVPIVRLNELCEQSMGQMENLTFDEASARFPDEVKGMLSDWTKYPPAGGEHFQEVQARTLGFLRRVIKEGRDTLLVSHNGPLSIIITHLLGLRDEKVSLFWLAHGSYSMFEVNKLAAKLRCFNK